MSKKPDKRNVTILSRHKATERTLDSLEGRQTKTPKGHRPRYGEHGLTHKQERFAELVADGNTLAKSYRGAYATANMKPSTVRRNASALMDNAIIAERIRSLLAVKESEHLQDAARIRRFVIERLHQIVDDPDATYASRVSSLVALGRIDVVGMFREKAESPSDNKTADQLKKEIEERLTRFLARDIKLDKT